MDVREAILTRRTVQRYTTEPIPEGCIERALECAIRAPNHKCTNPWRFTRVGPKTREKLVDIGVELKRKKAQRNGSELSEEKVAKLRAKYGNSPEVIVVSQVLADDAFRRKEDYASCACAIQNFMLSLWSEGVGSKWATGKMTRHPDTYELLGIDSEREEIIGFVWVGHSSRELIETPRRPLEEVYRELD
ncbi:MAG: nitroreductase family protein [Persicimonas sp.]